MLEALCTSEINDIMRNCKAASKYFIGTFPSDVDICLNSHEKTAFIMNIDDSSLPGSHWVAVFTDLDSNFYYLDTIHTEVPTRILEIARPFRNKYFLRKKVQSTKSELCGQYCILFIHELAVGTPFRKIEKMFRYRTRKQNDEFVRNWVINHRNVCPYKSSHPCRSHLCTIQ